MSTRDKILEAALVLFNEKGVENVSVRDIAEATGISHGNLRYHFRATTDTKAQVVEALFDACEQKADQIVEAVLTPPLDFGKIVHISRVQARYFWDFRFLLDHMISVCTRYPAVQVGMTRMYERRREELMYLFTHLKEKGWLRSDIPEDERAELIRHYLLVADFGVPYVKLFDVNQSPEAQFERYLRMWFFPLKCYLTETGRQELEQALAQELAILADEVATSQE